MLKSRTLNPFNRLGGGLNRRTTAFMVHHKRSHAQAGLALDKSRLHQRKPVPVAWATAKDLLLICKPLAGIAGTDLRKGKTAWIGTTFGWSSR
jgi:hypothetical protein